MSDLDTFDIKAGVRDALVEGLDVSLDSGYVPTLRDQFAMAAMNALQIPYSQCPSFGENKSVRAGYARLCYEIADAMMRERARK